MHWKIGAKLIVALIATTTIVAGCSMLPLSETPTEQVVWAPICIPERLVPVLDAQWTEFLDDVLRHNATYAERFGWDDLRDYCLRE
jgi:hypothetical protein